MPETMDERTSRRNWLKYATGAVLTAAMAGAGYYYFDRRPEPPIPTTTTETSTPSYISTSTSASTSTSTSASTSTSTSASTSKKIAPLEGTLFFDYSGSGKQDYLTDGSQEPAVSNAKVQLKDNAGKAIAQAVTDSAGYYKLEDVKAGSYRLYVEADKKFRYMCMSAEEFRAVARGYDVRLDDPKMSKKMDIGLMEGYLTLPFARPIATSTFYPTLEIGGRGYVDLDPRVGHYRNWRGGTEYHDGHLGTDFFVVENTPIRSASPGTVTKSYYSTDDGNTIVIKDLGGYLNIYCHLNTREVSVGKRLNRGNRIGLSGTTGKLAYISHLHFQFGGFGSARIDPYRDILNFSSKCFWTKDNDPQYPF
jgi:murein DD-endopeptidase MepM/ murein hydrolase activator NlpD